MLHGSAAVLGFGDLNIEHTWHEGRPGGGQLFMAQTLPGIRTVRYKQGPPPEHLCLWASSLGSLSVFYIFL